MGGGKIPDALDPPGNELVGHLLRRLRRDGDNAHQHLVGAAEMGQLGNVINGLAFLGLFRLGACVKGRQNVQTVLVKAAVAHQRLPQLARADQNGISGVVVPQKLLNIVDQSLPQIADLGASAVGDHGQILADLHLSHSQSVGQRRGGNMGRGIFRHIFQVRQIPRQTFQNRF